MRRDYVKKVPTTRVKPLHERAFAGMLPRTMSQGNDAFSSKDAAAEDSNAVASATADSKSAAPKSKDPSASAERSGAAEQERRDDDSDRTGSTKGDRDEKDADESADDKDADDKDADENEKERADRETKERAATTRRSASRPRRSRRDEDDDDDRPMPPQTEEALDVPKKHTIYMLGAMSALTVVLWFAAKLSCNIHPDQMRDPKHFSTRELAADPKNAAFEFHHKFETGDYTTAFDLATGEMKRVVETKLSECEQNADACVEKQKRLAGTIQSTARVMDRTDNRATVEITSFYKGTTGSKDFSFDVVKEGEFWRVASRRELATAAPQQGPTGAAAPNAPASGAPVEMSDQASSAQ